ncbi:metal-binding protein [Thermus sediminis]|uniref:metal-binding protein n=1 Tax=Thermus sediminis TaxID=1761908 RepID=UPI000E3D6D90|nr:metal-binding protein [Thermus sediminis]
MPAGRVHEAINLTALGLGGIAYLAYGGPLEDPRALAFALSYLTGTFLLSPDLDLAEKGVRAKRRWGVLGFLWRPYGWLFRHRGLSHTWILGPLTRLGYLFFLLFLLYGFFSGMAALLGASFALVLPPLPSGVLWWGLLGYYLSQWLHLLADGIYPDHDLKRLRRPR